VTLDDELVQAHDGLGDAVDTALAPQGIVDVFDQADVLKAGQQMGEGTAGASQRRRYLRAPMVAGADRAQRGRVRGASRSSTG